MATPMRRSSVARLTYPDGKKFAFAIIDDTDVATVANVRPVYRLLERLGMRVTKTVWPLGCPEGSPKFQSSETLEDPDYRAFVVDLQRRGFEVTWHGATMESSTRDRTLRGLDCFRQVFGSYPRLHANHAYNRENLYWGASRIDAWLLKSVYGRLDEVPADHYQGHVEGSPFWWGDLCARHISYCRNLNFNEINLARINPSMPYHDAARPLVDLWFSAADADGCHEFNELLRSEHQEQLERERGFCIVATHFGKGFARNGRVNSVTRQRLEALANRPGWFPSVGELLDWLRAQRTTTELPAREWRRMQWRWAFDLVRRRRQQRRRRAKRP
jgi:hypothetical protein